MASKYAHLPGLASPDQPDVFESIPDPDTSLVHASTHVPADQEPSTNEIERGYINAKSAFDRFRKSKKVADFTTAGSASDETIAEMLERLMRETDVLSGRIKNDKSCKAPFQDAGGEEGMSAMEMAAGLRKLEARLGQLGIESSSLTVKPIVGNSEMTEQLIGRLQRFKESFTLEKEAGKDCAGEAETGHVQYELTYTPERVEYNEQSKAAHLESRLATLERIVGCIDTEDSGMMVSNLAGPLVEHVKKLSEQVFSLTPEGAAMAERRLAGLVAQTEKFHNASKNIDTGKVAKVEELYKLVTRWDSVASSIPLVVDRLVALRKVHDDAARAAEGLAAVEQAQAQMQTTLRENKSILKEVAVSLENNVQQSLANFESLGARLSSVEQAFKAKA